MKFELFFHKSGMPENINQCYGEFDNTESLCVVIKNVIETHKENDEVLIKIKKDVPES
jgi:hypothetical protein